MSGKIYLTILMAFFCISYTVAQDNQIKIGVGVSLNPTALMTNGSSTAFLPIGFTNIYIPVMVTGNFRIEPEGGIFSISSESSSGSSTTETSTSILRLGIGLFYVHTIESSFNTYVGPRIGILSSSSTYTANAPSSTEEKTTQTDFFIGACLGGEYSFSSHFSIGSEVQLNYISFGDPERTPATSGSSTKTQNAFTSNALMFFRWYF